jgi:PIN domain nuclease of toxin-antitoxin system
MLLWLLFEPEKLSKRQVLAFHRAEGNFYFSAASLWELSIKFAKGTLKLNGYSPQSLREALLESGLKELPITVEETSNFYRLPRRDNHQDPFDRLLIWQAITNHLTFMTADGKISQYEEDGLSILR